MYERNVFITLTYDDRFLESPKLQLRDFQLFMKRLRKKLFTEFLEKFGKENWKLLSKKEQKNAFKPHQISVLYTGEYGEKEKRPHWHAIVFNWCPPDPRHKYTSDRGDQVFTSQILGPATVDEVDDGKIRLWNSGIAEFGSVTLESAGYVARYALKKTVHGNDDDHDYQPISKKSSGRAIGRTWLEQNWRDTFNHGFLIVDGKRIPIPRYYEKWLRKHQPDAWSAYVTGLKSEKIRLASAKSELEKAEENLANLQRPAFSKLRRSRVDARKKILEQKIKLLRRKL